MWTNSSISSLKDTVIIYTEWFTFKVLKVKVEKSVKICKHMALIIV